VKTLLRRGTSWLGLQEIDSARKDFKHVLSLEPNNRCDNHLLLTMECSAAFVALTLFCVTAFMLETLKSHSGGLECLPAGCFCIEFCSSHSNCIFNSYCADATNCLTGKHGRS